MPSEYTRVGARDAPMPSAEMTASTPSPAGPRLWASSTSPFTTARRACWSAISSGRRASATTLCLSVAERLVEAAAGVMRAKGLARTTTKEIARAAGYSEGTLYNHFASKEDLFVAVLGERLPGFVSLVTTLPERAGRGTVRENLTEVATTALAFYTQSVPMAAAVFAEPDLLARHIAGVRAAQAGPHQPNEAVAAYLRAEQHLGRLRADANPQDAADLLLGACFQQVP